MCHALPLQTTIIDKQIYCTIIAHLYLPYPFCYNKLSIEFIIIPFFPGIKCMQRLIKAKRKNEGMYQSSIRSVANLDDYSKILKKLIFVNKTPIQFQSF